MPKNNGFNSTYAGHQGVVTDARDNLHEVDPTKTIDGEDSPGLTVEPVGDLEETPAPGVLGPVTPVSEDDQDEESEPEDGDEEFTEGGADGDEPERVKPANQIPAVDMPKKSTTRGTSAARKSTDDKKD
jgi:hypothetical protein